MELCEHGYEHGYGRWVHTAEGWKPTGYPCSFLGPVPLPFLLARGRSCVTQIAAVWSDHPGYHAERR